MGVLGTICFLISITSVTRSLPTRFSGSTITSDSMTTDTPTELQTLLDEQAPIGERFSSLSPESLNDFEAMEYLKKYKYMKSNSQVSEVGGLVDYQAYQEALLSFQKIYGLEETGILDQQTVELISAPRCGVSDFDAEEVTDLHNGRKKRYTLHGSTWSDTSLTYKIIRYTPDLTEAEVDREIRRAFDVWETATPLRFSQVDAGESADIVILFQAKDHGDGYPFDGRRGTLAHAFYPRYGGDAHFDEDETWTINTFRGTNLFQVAAHEFGHSLGLAHSRITSALMAPFYRGYVRDFMLHQDDISGIQALYGGPVSTTQSSTTLSSTVGESTTTSKRMSEATQKITTEAESTTRRSVPSEPDLADVCAEGIFDAVTQHQDSDGKVRTYAFRKDYYMELDDGKIVDGYPKKISAGWKGLPANIDAALYWEPSYKTFKVLKDKKWQKVTKEVSPSRTYFFKGNLYWRFREGAMDHGYPKEITSTWNLPDDLDAAMMLGDDNQSYFFKGSSYYVFNRKHNRIENGYPRDITSLSKDFITDVDTGFHLEKKTYFTKGTQLYQLDNGSFRVARGYPKDTRTDLLGCHRLGGIVSELTDNAACITKSSLTFISIITSLVFVLFMI